MILYFILILIFILFASPVHAKYDPFSVPNNHIGIHIVDPNDLADAAKLVNHNGGDWGYVTLVIQEDDRDIGKWQRVMNEMRSLHLIPIVRLATHIQGDSWATPYNGSASDWARFLNTLNWPTENRYVIIFNEPNHANEWGKTLHPEEYARTLKEYAQKLHEVSEDFFILPAGLDVSAQTDGKSMDAEVYFRRMMAAEPDLFQHIDGWASHSYPNPGFSGSPYAIGRGTLRSYAWEHELRKKMNITKSLPVFITETGWVHREGIVYNYNLLTSDAVGSNLVIAEKYIWNDPKIVAVTPFVLNYQSVPFDHFSWRKLVSHEFYPQYYTYQNISKISGKPKQRERYTLDHKLIPDTLVAGSTYVITGLIKNEGQGIYDGSKGYSIKIITEPSGFSIVSDPLPVMEPGQFGTLTFHIDTPSKPGTYQYRVEVHYEGITTKVETGTLNLVPPPSIDVSSQFGWRRDNNISNATVLIYDNLNLVHKIPGVVLINGKATIRDLRNVVPGIKYRIVILAPYYLPRQKIITVGKDSTLVQMPRFYPLDFNIDGAFTASDIVAALKLTPHFITSLFVGN